MNRFARSPSTPTVLLNACTATPRGEFGSGAAPVTGELPGWGAGLAPLGTTAPLSGVCAEPEIGWGRAELACAPANAGGTTAPSGFVVIPVACAPAKDVPAACCDCKKPHRISLRLLMQVALRRRIPTCGDQSIAFLRRHPAWAAGKGLSARHHNRHPSDSTDSSLLPQGPPAHRCVRPARPPAFAPHCSASAPTVSRHALLGRIGDQLLLREHRSAPAPAAGRD